MHHCFFTSGSWEGNAAWIRWVGLGNALLERGERVSYVLDDCQFNRDLTLPAGAARLYVPQSHRQYFERRRILKNPFDFVHLVNASPKAVAAVAGCSRRLVIHWDELPTLKKLPRLRKLLYRSLEAWARRSAHAHVSCTVFLQQYLRDAYGLQTAHIPHAPYLQPRPDVPSPFAERTFVYMGTMTPLWDHDILFDAALQLARRGKRPRIVVLGGGPDLERWREYVRSHALDNVALPGFTSGDALWGHLRHAHVLLFPIRNTDVNRSRCPSKVFAYAQAGRPILTSRVGEIPFLLGDDPLYVESAPEGFAGAMEDLMDRDLPDVSYDLEQHSWAARSERLIGFLGTITDQAQLSSITSAAPLSRDLMRTLP